MRHACFALAALTLFLAASTRAVANMPPPKPPSFLPANAVMLSPCVPGMGEHWGVVKNFPLGPIYGVYQGKPVFTEMMVDQRLFAQGSSWDDMLKPLPGYRINHVDVDFLPHGHPGYPIPHYDLHAYYVPHEVHIKFCPHAVR